MMSNNEGVKELEDSIIRQIEIFQNYRQKGQLQGAMAVQRKLMFDIPDYYRRTEGNGVVEENRSFISRHRDILDYDLEKVGNMVIYKNR